MKTNDNQPVAQSKPNSSPSSAVAGLTKLNSRQQELIKEWSADSPHGDLWGNDETRAINLATFARSILLAQQPKKLAREIAKEWFSKSRTFLQRSEAVNALAALISELPEEAVADDVEAARHPTMKITSHERAENIIKDLLVNHLPRVQEGLEKGYVDENQILVMYDHAVRARILTEHGQLFLSEHGVSSPVGGVSYSQCPECKGTQFHHSRCRTLPPLASPVSSVERDAQQDLGIPGGV